MRIPIIETTTISNQFKKIMSEYHECKIEFEKMGTYAERDKAEVTKDLQLEALDLLTATMNLVEMLNIPPETIKEWQDKMRCYEKTKGYKIEKWVEVNE